jgi:hypothetical protein
MKNFVLTLTAAAAVLIGSASSAAAQASGTTANPTFDLGAAYQFLHVSGGDEGEGQSFPYGLAIDGARYWGALGLAAEGGWAYDSTDDDEFAAKTNYFHAAAGPRFAVRSPGRVRPYAQVLFGVSAVHFSIDNIDDSGDTDTAFMIQPGGGVNFVLGDGWGLFGDVAYRRTFWENNGANEIRVLVGVRMILD